MSGLKKFLAIVGAVTILFMWRAYSPSSWNSFWSWILNIQF